jgi:superfamily II helicase
MPKTKHELNVPTYQMCILMLFNQHVTVTYKERVDAVCEDCAREFTGNFLQFAMKAISHLVR